MKTVETVKNHFNSIADQYDNWKQKNSYYYSLLKAIYRRYIPPNASVIEYGCATGEILAACRPSRGAGIDISGNLLALARQKYPQYNFIPSDAEKFESAEKFDYAVASDLFDHVVNLPGVIKSCYNVLTEGGRMVATTINPLWDPVMDIAERLNMKMPEGPHAFVSAGYLQRLFLDEGFNIVRSARAIILPMRIPIMSALLNRVVPAIPLLRRVCLVQVIVAEKRRS